MPDTITDCAPEGPRRNHSRAPADIDHEQVRMLVLTLGVRAAARKLNLSENTVLAWSRKGGWLAHARPVVAETLPIPPTISQTLTTISPADALRDVLAEDSRETRISLSRSARRMAQDAEAAPLESAGDVLQVAKVAAMVHGWESAGSGGVTLNVLIQ